MSQRVSGYARKPDEAYDTPAWVVHILERIIPEGIQTIWEPAPGKGQLAGALRELGFNVVETSEDFFLFVTHPVCDAIVTNPPFGPRGLTASMFVRKWLKMSRIRYLALLLRVDYDSAKSRVDLFRDCPVFAGKLTMLARIKWFPGASGPSDNHAWFMWDRKHEGPPVIQYQRG